MAGAALLRRGGRLRLGASLGRVKARGVLNPPSLAVRRAGRMAAVLLGRRKPWLMRKGDRSHPSKPWRSPPPY